MKQAKWAKEISDNTVKEQVTRLSPRRPVAGVVGQPSVYTGTGSDGKVNPHKVVAIDKIAFHEGEEVVGADTVQRLGGNQNVKKVINQALLQKEANRPNVMGFKDAGTVPPVYPALDPLVLPLNTAEAPTTTSHGNTPINLVNTIRNSLGNVLGNTQNNVRAAVSDTITRTSNLNPVAANVVGQQNQRTSGEAIRSVGSVMSNSPGGTFPIMNTAAGGTTTTGTTTTPVRTRADRNIDFAVQQQADLARGNSKLQQALANYGWNQLGNTQQAGMTQALTNIANNPNLTDGMKNTMIAEQLRNNGIQNSDLAAKLALGSLQAAETAGQNLYAMATGERAHTEGLLASQLSSFLASGDTKNAASIWKQLYGTDLDVSGLNTDNLNTATTGLRTNIAGGDKDPYSVANMGYLHQAFKATHNGKDGSDIEIKAWNEQTGFFGTQVGAGDQSALILSDMSDSDVASLFDVSDLNNYAYTTADGTRLTGRAAADFVVSRLQVGGGITFEGRIPHINYDMFNDITSSSGAAGVVTDASVADLTPYDPASTVTDARGNIYMNANGKAVLVSDYNESPDFYRDSRFSSTSAGTQVDLGGNIYVRGPDGWYGEGDGEIYDRLRTLTTKNANGAYEHIGETISFADTTGGDVSRTFVVTSAGIKKTTTVDTPVFFSSLAGVQAGFVENDMHTGGYLPDYGAIITVGTSGVDLRGANGSSTGETLKPGHSYEHIQDSKGYGFKDVQTGQIMYYDWKVNTTNVDDVIWG